MNRIGLLNWLPRHSDELNLALNRLSSIEGYEIETIDDFDAQETVTDAIWGLINICDVLIAYVDGHIRGVEYEIGLAHGAGKPVIIVADSESNVPPEIRGQRILITSKRSFLDDNFIFRLKEALEEALQRKFGYLGPRSGQKGRLGPQYTRPSSNFRDLFVAEGPRRFKLFEKWFAEIAEGVEGWEITEPESLSRSDRGFDLVIWNSQEDSELAILGNPIAVEIKAIASMNSAMLHQFLHRSKKSGIRGVILATTGSNDKRTEQRLQKLRKEEGINAIALDRDDLINVKHSGDMLALVKSKVREIIYGQEL